MEACFLTSTSFNKTVDFAAPIKTALFGRKYTHHVQMKQTRTSNVVTCCQIGSNSPEDDYKSKIDAADWRSFRARLINDEQASKKSNPDVTPTISRSSENVTDEQRWVHKIHEPERGCLLIATEKLDGVHIFERTVVLLLSVGPVGPTGIILNRPSLMSIKETRSTVFDTAGTFSDRPLFFGGPLEEGLFLLNPQNGVETIGLFDEVVNGLYYGTKESVGCAAELVKREVVDVNDFRFFDGYCGWEKEQLKDEIKAGYWIVAASSPNLIGLQSVGDVGLLDEILGLMGHEKVLFRCSGVVIKRKQRKVMKVYVRWRVMQLKPSTLQTLSRARMKRRKT